MSEVIAKPLKRVLISRKLAFVVGIVGAAALIGVMAWSEKSHNESKATKAKEESEKAAQALTEAPVSQSLDTVLQTQKLEAERAAAEAEKAKESTATANLESELNMEIGRGPAPDSSPTAEDLAKAKQEELEMSAYGSSIVALKKNGTIGAMASGIDELVNGGRPATKPEGSIPDEDMAAVRDAQRKDSVTTANGRNLAFLSDVRAPGGEIYVEKGGSERVLHEGSIIPAVLARAVNSDLPGQVELRTTRDVYDSVNARVLVIPRGTRAIGAYNSDVNTGQNRVLVIFHRLIFPDGRTVNLGNAQGADREGASGFSDRVNTHYWKMVGSSALLAAIARVAEGNGNTNVTIGGTTDSSSNAPGQIMVDTSKTVLGRYTNLPPTIEIRPGTRVNIVVNKDIIL